MRTVMARLAFLISMAVLTIALGARPALAGPIGVVEYVETGLGGGLFRYDYTLMNQGNPLTDTGFDAYDLALFFSPAASLVGSLLPSGWDLISGSGFADAFSLNPGASPLGTDVGPGQSLPGFSFTFDQRLGSIPFQLVFSNPLDAVNPLVFDGQTTAAVSEEPSPSPVPEPSTLLLMSSGALGLALRRRHRSRLAPPTGERLELDGPKV